MGQMGSFHDAGACASSRTLPQRRARVIAISPASDAPRAAFAGACAPGFSLRKRRRPPIPLPYRRGTEHEATVAAAARGLREIVDHRLHIDHSLARGDANEREVRAIERLVARAPPRGSREGRDRLGVAVHEKENAS